MSDITDTTDKIKSLQTLGISELLREKFTHALDDFISLDKKISETREAFTEVINALPDAIDGRISEKLHLLLETAETLEADLKESKDDIRDYVVSLKMDFNKEIAFFLSNLENEVKTITSILNKDITAFTKKTIAAAKPVSFSKVVSISFLAVMVISISLSSLFYYFTKKNFDYELHFYANVYKQTNDILEKNLKFLPKDKKDIAVSEINVINNKQLPK